MGEAMANAKQVWEVLGMHNISTSHRGEEFGFSKHDVDHSIASPFRPEAIQPSTGVTG